MSSSSSSIATTAPRSRHRMSASATSGTATMASWWSKKRVTLARRRSALARLRSTSTDPMSSASAPTMSAASRLSVAGSTETFSPNAVCCCAAASSIEATPTAAATMDDAAKPIERTTAAPRWTPPARGSPAAMPPADQHRAARARNRPDQPSAHRTSGGSPTAMRRGRVSAAVDLATEREVTLDEYGEVEDTERGRGGDEAPLARREPGGREGPLARMGSSALGADCEHGRMPRTARSAVGLICEHSRVRSKCCGGGTETLCAIRARSAVGAQSASTVVGALSARSAVGLKSANTAVYKCKERWGFNRVRYSCKECGGGLNLRARSSRSRNLRARSSALSVQGVRWA